MATYTTYTTLFHLTKLGIELDTSSEVTRQIHQSMLDYTKPFAPPIASKLVRLLESAEFHYGKEIFSSQLVDGSTRLHWVANTNVLPLATFWSQRININKRDNQGLTPLHIAAYNKNWIMYHHLISLGADDNMQNYCGVSPRTIYRLNFSSTLRTSSRTSS